MYVAKSKYGSQPLPEGGVGAISLHKKLVNILQNTNIG